jgi:hypothetical protein
MFVDTSGPVQVQCSTVARLPQIRRNCRHALHENNEIYVNFGIYAPVSLTYTWNKNERNPLAWPYFATVGDQGSSLSINLARKGARILD